MRTTYRTPQAEADRFLALMSSTPCIGSVLPLRFMKIMRENIGSANKFSPIPAIPDGLERKNPLIVALGDSVTAGHFEFVARAGAVKRVAANGKPIWPGREVIDVQECYVDKFRSKLIDKYEDTSLSVINSGIAGDTILGMERRLDRDVLRYQPDLVLINATLNWMADCGDNDRFKEALTAVVYRINHETNAEVVIITPNMSFPTPFDHPSSTVRQRVEIDRQVAAEQNTCLVDVYKVWEMYQAAGGSIENLLANSPVHPSATGHEAFAIALMQLFR